MNAGAVKVGLAMAGIFVAGAVAGGFSGAAYERHRAEQVAERRAERISAQKVIDDRYKALVKELQLTAEQEDCIKPVMYEFVEELRAARRKAFAEVNAVVAEMNARIETELTPSQLAKFREIQEKHEKHRQRMEEELRRRASNPDQQKDQKPEVPAPASAPNPPRP